ncbi:MAG: acyltransferase [Pseudomonadota bacterium]
MSTGRTSGWWSRAFGRGRLLSEVAVGRANHFNLLRMLAASGVILSHAFVVAGGPDAMQPLEQATGRDLGTLCVYVFFAISGFFVAQSFDRAPSLAAYLRARALRLFPALSAMLVLTVLLGFAITDWLAREYWLAAVGYVLRNLTLVQTQAHLADIFTTLPLAGWVNGPIWTLFYEMLGYLGILFAGLAGAFRRPAYMVVALRLFLVLYAVAMTPAFGIHQTMGYRKEALFQFGLAFSIGTAAYVWRDRIRLDPVFLALPLAVLSWHLIEKPALALKQSPGAVVPEPEKHIA